MRESAPAGRGEVTKEHLENALKNGVDENALRIRDAWLVGRMGKERNIGVVHERLSFRLETAWTLQELGMLQDAREMFEDVQASAEHDDEPEIAAEAAEAIRSLPTVH